MKTLYFDCFSGISGDMVIGALLDAGGDFDDLKSELQKLQIDEEYELNVSKVVKNGINSTKFDVILKNEDTSQIGHSHTELNANHLDETKNEHVHSHEDHHSHGVHHHEHRTYKSIVQMIKLANFSKEVEKNALDIFKKIGEAESKIHNMPLNEVHFHEVGATDSIIDIVGAVILISQLEIDSIQCSPVTLGSGKISIDHGIYPVPAPATLEIMRGIPIQETTIRAELTTPTGAGIISVLTKNFSPSIPAMIVDKIGYGAGTKNFQNHPNVLRIVIGKTDSN